MLYTTLFALMASDAVMGIPQFGGAPTNAREPSDGPIPTKKITACTNMFTQPNATPKTVR
jgi:hypothetical protein